MSILLLVSLVHLTYGTLQTQVFDIFPHILPLEVLRDGGFCPSLARVTQDVVVPLDCLFL